MTPHRASSGRGTFMLDRIIAGIGRIQRASGTNSEPEWRRINALITEFEDLMRQPNPDPVYRAALVALHDGCIGGKRVRGLGLMMLQAKRERRLEAFVLPPKPAELTPAERRAAEPLEPIWLQWATEGSTYNACRLRAASWRRLKSRMPAGATWLHLPDALLAMRLEAPDRPAGFNRTRTNAMSIARMKLSRGHPVYLALAAIDQLKESPAERAGPRLDKAIAIRDALPAHIGAMWWTMFITGMGPGEYDGAWEIVGAGVSIPGTKAASRVRIVPHLGPLVRRGGFGWRRFQQALAGLPPALRVDPDVPLQAYDARRGYAQMLEQHPAITTARLKVYMGHALNITERYTRAHQLQAVEEDGPRLRAVIEAAEQQHREVRKEGMRSA